MSYVRRVFFCLLLSGITTLAWSQAAARNANPMDYEGVNRFPGAEIVDYRTPGISNYRLALGRMQRVNGRVSAGREERVRGELTRITYRIPDGYSAADVFSHFSQQMLAAGPELFRCAGRGCGSSNFWANDVFENRILYGPEIEQFYLASGVGSDEQHIHAYLALYVITRGNRSVYAQLDVLELSDVVSDAATLSPEALVLQLRQEGSIIVQGIGFDAQDGLVAEGNLDVLVTALRNSPLTKVYLVGHLAGTQALDVLLRRSQARAEAVRTQMIAVGIEPTRIAAQGVGPLAPTCRQAPCEERIEVVLQP